MAEESFTQFGNESYLVKHSFLFFSNHSCFLVIVHVFLISIFFRETFRANLEKISQFCSIQITYLLLI